MTDPDAATTGSFDIWWAAHSCEILASAAVAAFMGYTAGRKSGTAEARDAERQRWDRGIGAMHTPTTDEFWCSECTFAWPCRTARAIADLLDGDGND